MPQSPAVEVRLPALGSNRARWRAAEAAAGIVATLREASSRWKRRLSAGLHTAWTRGRLPLAVLLAGVGLSVVLSYAARVEAERSAQVRFDADAARVAREVREDRKSVG